MVAVGDLRECRATVPTDAEIIRAELILPGFTDCHVHPLQGGLDLLGCNLQEADTAAGYLRSGRPIRRRPPGRRLDHRRRLELPAIPRRTGHRDRVRRRSPATDPAYLVNTDRHGAWVNSAACAGRASTPPPPTLPTAGSNGTATGVRPGCCTRGQPAWYRVDHPETRADHLRRRLLAAPAPLARSRAVTAWQDALVGRVPGISRRAAGVPGPGRPRRVDRTVEFALWWERGAGLNQLASPPATTCRSRGGVGRPTVRRTASRSWSTGSWRIGRPRCTGRTGTAASRNRCGSTFLSRDEFDRGGHRCGQATDSRSTSTRSAIAR